MDLMSPLPRLDPVRAYGPAERELVFYRDHGVCQKCKKAVLWADSEIDHVTPYAVGGETSLENARLVHKACHTRGVSALIGFSDSGEPVEVVGKPWEEDVPSGAKLNVLDQSGKRVAIKHLYKAGLMGDGCKLKFLRKEGNIEARFVAPGSFSFRDAAGESIYSSFNSLVSEKVGGARNIWERTDVEFPTGEVISLKDLRVKFLESHDAEDDDDMDDE